VTLTLWSRDAVSGDVCVGRAEAVSTPLSSLPTGMPPTTLHARDAVGAVTGELSALVASVSYQCVSVDIAAPTATGVWSCHVTTAGTYRPSLHHTRDCWVSVDVTRRCCAGGGVTPGWTVGGAMYALIPVVPARDGAQFTLVCTRDDSSVVTGQTAVTPIGVGVPSRTLSTPLAEVTLKLCPDAAAALASHPSFAISQHDSASDAPVVASSAAAWPLSCVQGVSSDRPTSAQVGTLVLVVAAVDPPH
jgi:hypothetical protein